MNSPYCGKFRITQKFKGSAHDGLDLVGIDSKEIHATATGEVVYANWENPGNHSQGFGQYVVIKAGSLFYHYGHLSQIKCSVGQKVKITDVIGIEGSTGYSTGSHCHYCVRTSMARGTFVDVNQISGIPNVEGGVYDDGYRPSSSSQTAPSTSQNYKVEPAKSFDKDLSGAYKVTATALNVRAGAGTDKTILVTIPTGTNVRCYGYYTTVGSVKWYYIQFSYKSKTYTGFASSDWLEKA